MSKVKKIIINKQVRYATVISYRDLISYLSQLPKHRLDLLLNSGSGLDLSITPFRDVSPEIRDMFDDSDSSADEKKIDQSASDK